MTGRRGPGRKLASCCCAKVRKCIRCCTACRCRAWWLCSIGSQTHSHAYRYTSSSSPGPAWPLPSTPPVQPALQEMLARTQALEDRLMRLQQEKNEVEAELARVPTNNPGRKLQVGRQAWGGRARSSTAGAGFHLSHNPEKNTVSARVAGGAGLRMQLPGIAHRTCLWLPPQDRRRKGELEQRLEVVNREVSAIRLQLKKMGYK